MRKNNILILALACITKLTFADSFDQQMETAVKRYDIPNISIAIIENNKIIKAKIYSSKANKIRAEDALFQAASISKALSSYGTLLLVQEGKLALDQPINNYLKRWKIPVNNFNKNNPVTLAQIMSNTSGLSVSGFAGYDRSSALPKLLEIINGKQPANNMPIRSSFVPGSEYYYSGGGYEVMRLAIEDMSSQSFEDFMNSRVLPKIGMSNSIYAYPLPQKYHKNVMRGHLMSGEMIDKGWKNYPIAASGGLWSTASDIARFAIDISKAFKTKDGLIKSELAEKMLQKQPSSKFGLGVEIFDADEKMSFRKSGHNLGYLSQMLMLPKLGKGAVIMINSEMGIYLIPYFYALVAKTYNWPCITPLIDEGMPPIRGI